MRVHHEPHVDTTVLDAAALLAIVLGGSPNAATMSPGRAGAEDRSPAPVGAWQSADGVVRLNIRTDGTYAGKVAGRRRAAHGTYNIDGATMTLRDDSGLHTRVTLRRGELEMAGHRLAPA